MPRRTGLEGFASVSSRRCLNSLECLLSPSTLFSPRSPFCFQDCRPLKLVFFSLLIPLVVLLVVCSLCIATRGPCRAPTLSPRVPSLPLPLPGALVAGRTAEGASRALHSAASAPATTLVTHFSSPLLHSSPFALAASLASSHVTHSSNSSVLSKTQLVASEVPLLSRVSLFVASLWSLAGALAASLPRLSLQRLLSLCFSSPPFVPFNVVAIFFGLLAWPCPRKFPSSPNSLGGLRASAALAVTAFHSGFSGEARRLAQTGRFASPSRPPSLSVASLSFFATDSQPPTLRLSSTGSAPSCGSSLCLAASAAERPSSLSSSASPCAVSSSSPLSSRISPGGSPPAATAARFVAPPSSPRWGCFARAAPCDLDASPRARVPAAIAPWRHRLLSSAASPVRLFLSETPTASLTAAWRTDHTSRSSPLPSFGLRRRSHRLFPCVPCSIISPPHASHAPRRPSASAVPASLSSAAATAQRRSSQPARSSSTASRLSDCLLSSNSSPALSASSASSGASSPPPPPLFPPVSSSAPSAFAASSPPSLPSSASFLSREWPIYGREHVARLPQARVLLVGLEGVGVEAAKCLLLAGVGRLSLLDCDPPGGPEEASANFAIPVEAGGEVQGATGEEEEGQLPDSEVRTRAELAHAALKRLALPHSRVELVEDVARSSPRGAEVRGRGGAGATFDGKTRSELKALLSSTDVVVLSNRPVQEVCRINRLCREIQGERRVEPQRAAASAPSRSSEVDSGDRGKSSRAPAAHAPDARAPRKAEGPFLVAVWTVGLAGRLFVDFGESFCFGPPTDAHIDLPLSSRFSAASLSTAAGAKNGGDCLPAHPELENGRDGNTRGRLGERANSSRLRFQPLDQALHAQGSVGDVCGGGSTQEGTNEPSGDQTERAAEHESRMPGEDDESKRQRMLHVAFLALDALQITQERAHVFVRAESCLASSSSATSVSAVGVPNSKTNSRDLCVLEEANAQTAEAERRFIEEKATFFWRRLRRARESSHPLQSSAAMRGDAESFEPLPEASSEEEKKELEQVQKIATDLWRSSRGHLAPIASVMGGLAAQEVLKAISGRFTPVHQFLYFDALDILPTSRSPASLPLFSPRSVSASSGSPGPRSAVPPPRWLGQEQLFGPAAQRRMNSLHVFLAGAGAVGCELLKLFALMGVGCRARAGLESVASRPRAAAGGGEQKRTRAAGGPASSSSPDSRTRTRQPSDLVSDDALRGVDDGPQGMQTQGNETPRGQGAAGSDGMITDEEGGCITVADADLIERSNLNRQLLFTEADVHRPKAVAAALAAQRLNKHLRVRPICAFVGRETEDQFFNWPFWEKQDLVVMALDTIAARMYLDSQCLLYQKPLIEAGTLGLRGHAQSLVPHLTESYGSTADIRGDDEEAPQPTCSVRLFPSSPLHLVQWATELFERAFGQLPGKAAGLLADLEAHTEFGLPAGEEQGDLVRTMNLTRDRAEVSDRVRKEDGDQLKRTGEAAEAGGTAGSGGESARGQPIGRHEGSQDGCGAPEDRRRGLAQPSEVGGGGGSPLSSPIAPATGEGFSGVSLSFLTKAAGEFLLSVLPRWSARRARRRQKGGNAGILGTTGVRAQREAGEEAKDGAMRERASTLKRLARQLLELPSVREGMRESQQQLGDFLQTALDAATVRVFYQMQEADGDEAGESRREQIICFFLDRALALFHKSFVTEIGDLRAGMPESDKPGENTPDAVSRQQLEAETDATTLKATPDDEGEHAGPERQQDQRPRLAVPLRLSENDRDSIVFIGSAARLLSELHGLTIDFFSHGEQQREGSRRRGQGGMHSVPEEDAEREVDMGLAWDFQFIRERLRDVQKARQAASLAEAAARASEEPLHALSWLQADAAQHRDEKRPCTESPFGAQRLSRFCAALVSRAPSGRLPGSLQAVLRLFGTDKHKDTKQENAVLQVLKGCTAHEHQTEESKRKTDPHLLRIARSIAMLVDLGGARGRLSKNLSSSVSSASSSAQGANPGSVGGSSVDWTLRASPRLSPLAYDKDAAVHLSFVTAAARLRGRCFSLPPGLLDLPVVQQLSGRIVPATSTATTVAAGLAALELYRLVHANILGEDRDSSSQTELPAGRKADAVNKAEAGGQRVSRHAPSTLLAPSLSPVGPGGQDEETQDEHLTPTLVLESSLQNCSDAYESTCAGTERSARRSWSSRLPRSWQGQGRLRTRLRTSFFNLSAPFLTQAAPMPPPSARIIGGSLKGHSFTPWDCLRLTLREPRRRKQDGEYHRTLPGSRWRGSAAVQATRRKHEARAQRLAPLQASCGVAQEAGTGGSRLLAFGKRADCERERGDAAASMVTVEELVRMLEDTLGVQVMLLTCEDAVLYNREDKHQEEPMDWRSFLLMTRAKTSDGAEEWPSARRDDARDDKDQPERWRSDTTPQALGSRDGGVFKLSVDMSEGDSGHFVQPLDFAPHSPTASSASTPDLPPDSHLWSVLSSTSTSSPGSSSEAPSPSSARDAPPPPLGFGAFPSAANFDSHVRAEGTAYASLADVLRTVLRRVREDPQPSCEILSLQTQAGSVADAADLSADGQGNRPTLENVAEKRRSFLSWSHMRRQGAVGEKGDKISNGENVDQDKGGLKWLVVDIVAVDKDDNEVAVPQLKLCLWVKKEGVRRFDG
ncbi:hypothetical protein BESB_033090 [Besnoitia besnoiti]|uniref:THIF-type NAD/FAD binding fold domain-containing protein n=1 Tax=Besnoitia besnoiti TaxID=94643 RepID=A0A2A9M547_BESBE|nr:uncharacterized protein BESB_033090 [Besnoitia besnoiti]PFH31036.1 hypothetical protein BESB_033090 [Besnoitia besnoiti]